MGFGKVSKAVPSRRQELSAAGRRLAHVYTNLGLLGSACRLWETSYIHYVTSESSAEWFKRTKSFLSIEKSYLLLCYTTSLMGYSTTNHHQKNCFDASFETYAYNGRLKIIEWPVCNNMLIMMGNGNFRVVADDYRAIGLNYVLWFCHNFTVGIYLTWNQAFAMRAKLQHSCGRGAWAHGNLF